LSSAENGDAIDRSAASLADVQRADGVAMQVRRIGVEAMLGLEGVKDGGGAGDLAPEVLAAANINPTTRLATDYLNHFNNVVMLLEFIATMPDFVEEILQWKPVGYQSYFATSNFRYRELAIAAYSAADGDVRARFEAIIADLDAAVVESQTLLTDFDPADPAISVRILDLVRGQMQPLIAEASGVINGSNAVSLETIESPAGNAQDSIDELFG
jgi:hypothetical protein